jgi:hypothetical protein
MFANRVALQIFDCRGLLCGKIVWLLRPDDPAGQPDRDQRNPDPALRQRHLCGLTIVWGLRPTGQNHWSSGWLYDPYQASRREEIAGQSDGFVPQPDPFRRHGVRRMLWMSRPIRASAPAVLTGFGTNSGAVPKVARGSSAQA